MLFKNHSEITKAELMGVIARADSLSKAILERVVDTLIFPTNLEKLKAALLLKANALKKEIQGMNLALLKRYYLLKHKVYVIEGANPKFYFEAILMLGQSSRTYKITDSYKAHAKTVEAWLKAHPGLEQTLDFHAAHYKPLLSKLAAFIKDKIDILSCDTKNFLNEIITLVEEGADRVDRVLVDAILFFREDALAEEDKKVLLDVRERDGKFIVFFVQDENESELARVMLTTIHRLVRIGFNVKNNKEYDFLALCKFFVNERYDYLTGEVNLSFFEFYQAALINSLEKAVQNDDLGLLGQVCLRYLMMSGMLKASNHPDCVNYLDLSEKKLAFVTYLMGVTKPLDPSPRPLDQVHTLFLTQWFNGEALERVKAQCFEMIKDYLVEDPQATLENNSRLNILFNSSTKVDPVKNELQIDYSEKMRVMLRDLGREPVALGDPAAMAAHDQKKLEKQFEKFKEFKSLTMEEKRGRFLALLKAEAFDDAEFVLTQKWFDINYGDCQSVTSDEQVDECQAPVLWGVMRDITLERTRLDAIYAFMFKHGVDLFLAVRKRRFDETAFYSCFYISLIEWAKVNKNYFYEYVIEFMRRGCFENYMGLHYKVLMAKKDIYNYQVESAYAKLFFELIRLGLADYFKGERPSPIAALQPLTTIAYVLGGGYQDRQDLGWDTFLARSVFKREFLSTTFEENQLITYLRNPYLSWHYHGDASIYWVKPMLLKHMKSVLIACLKENEPHGFPPFHRMCLAYQLLRMGFESRKVKANTKSFSEFIGYYNAMTAVTCADFAALPVTRLYERIRVYLTEAVVEYLLIENNRLFSELQMSFFEKECSLGHEYEYSLLGFLVFYHSNTALFKAKQAKSTNFDWIEVLYQMIVQKLNGSWYETQLDNLPENVAKQHASRWHHAVCQYTEKQYPMGAILESIVLGDEQHAVSPSAFFVVLFALRNVEEPLFGLKNQETFNQLFLSKTVINKFVTFLLSVAEDHRVKLFKEKMSEILKTFKGSERIQDQIAKESINAMQDNQHYCLAFQILQYGRRSTQVHATTKSYQSFMLFASEPRSQIEVNGSTISLRPSPLEDDSAL